MKTVLITGASDGIGRELVDLYAAQGWRVFATGRRLKEELARPLPESCTYISSDLTAKLEPILADLPDELDVAVLNAGVGKVASPADHTPADVADMIALNTTAPLLLAQALYGKLSKVQGTLAFIGSTAARGAHKDFCVYAATKAALQGAHRALKLEWQGKVTVLMIHPGPTATAMHDKAGLGSIAARRFFTAPNVVATAIQRAIAQKKDTRLGPIFTLRHALWGAQQ